jgi:hypothetical protein
VVNPIELVAEVHLINPGMKQRRIVLSMPDSYLHCLESKASAGAVDEINDGSGEARNHFLLENGLLEPYVPRKNALTR